MEPDEHPDRVILTRQAAEGREELIRLLGEGRRRRLLQLLLVPPSIERRGGGKGRIGAEGHAPAAAAAVVLDVAVVQEAVGDDAVGVVLMMVGVVTWVLVLVLLVALVQPSS